ncbi:hypothetical protein OM076_21335 [Solirubrobacter ginsenosidimutans]|uniref:Uncharacterized protein n=1 Tax=Solirubrobacter ginsenosidimutans TaxID=490573 RepID=A0A9X3MTN5_9ACTN|nr:hypothetical protein [Solirubrobacter ginsenosidimutans]MDA0162831.1 hypothetical protein [Solirubrobacter ginsenosidimutans]
MRSWSFSTGKRATMADAITHAAPGAQEQRETERITDWLSELRVLRGVPFSYLVPDEGMLPPESIRFFALDEAWVQALLDGAFSLGRSAAGDADRERSALEQVAQAAAGRAATGRAEMLEAQVGESVEVTGLLLRSQAVWRWPTLEVRGFSDEAGTAAIALARLDRLGPEVLLALFAGRLRAVTLSEPAEALHFGVTDEAHLRVGNRRVVDVGALRAQWPEATTPGAFAQALVQQAHQVRFIAREPG